MKKLYSNPTKIIVLMFSLFLLTGFYSCDKSAQLDGTVWKSDFFEKEMKDIFSESDFDDIVKGYITFSFNDNTVSILTDMDIYDKNNNLLIEVEPATQLASYTYKGKKLTIIYESVEILGTIVPERYWTGTVVENKISMDESNGFALDFYKQ